MGENMYNYSYGKHGSYGNTINRKTKQNRKVSKQTVVKFIACVAIVFLLSVGVIGKSIALRDINQETLHREEHLAILEEETQELRRIIAKNSSFAKIEDYAVNNLGMVKAEEVQIVAVNRKKDEIKMPQETQTTTTFLAQALDNLINKFSIVHAEEPQSR
ncbi:MAG: hypothetical protein ACOCQR_01395 [bacterium]